MSNFSNIDYRNKNDKSNMAKIANYLESSISAKPVDIKLNNKLNVDVFDSHFNNKTIDMKVKQNDNVGFKEVKILNPKTEIWANSVGPEMTIRGMGLNRWYNLYKNPQENCIEKFDRIGMNSVLDVLDTHVPCKVTQKMLNGFSL